jgi:hypothetical protein
MAASGAGPPSPRGFPFETLALLGVLILLVVLLAVVVMVARARFLAHAPKGPARSSGLVDQLRQMRDDGRMTEAEFQAVRSRLNARLRDEVKTPPSEAGTPRPRPSGARPK